MDDKLTAAAGESGVIVANAGGAADLFRRCFAAAAAGERLAIAHLDSGRKLIELVVVPSDGSGETGLPVRRILEDSLRLGGSRLLIAQHRLGGDPQPTAADVAATRELDDTASRLGIRLVDHLIFAGDEQCSLRVLGLL
jgi:DNA repair protein RadC